VVTSRMVIAPNQRSFLPIFIALRL
jgi:hypothetical protein